MDETVQLAVSAYQLDGCPALSRERVGHARLLPNLAWSLAKVEGHPYM